MFFQILRCWASLQQSQWFRKERLHEIQDAGLKEIVNHAYHNVPFYSKLYRSYGVDLAEIGNASDLSKLPAITRRDLQEEPLQCWTALQEVPQNIGERLIICEPCLDGLTLALKRG